MLALRCFVFALFASLSLDAVGEVLLETQSSRGRRRSVGVPEIGLDIYPLAGIDPALPVDDLEPVGAIVGNATVVALGEGSHYSGGFYTMKHRVFRYLVQEKGFRAFAIESNWESVERTNNYVQTCNGTAENAIKEEHIVWQSTEYADLVRWMCEWNRTHTNPADRLTIFGFDIQQPERDGPGLTMFVTQNGLSQNDPRVTGLHSCEKAFGLSHPFGEIPPAVHATCIDALAGIETFLEENRTSIIQRTSQTAFDIAMLRVVGLRANQEEIFEIAADFAKGFNYRDLAMAYAFHVRRAMTAPGAKTMLWAANVHVAQNRLPHGEVPLGSHLETDLGPDFVSFALTAHQIEVPQAPGVCRFVDRPAGTVDDRLITYGHKTLLARPKGRQYEVMPMSAGFFAFRPFADFDGILFLERSPSMHPLFWKHCH